MMRPYYATTNGGYNFTPLELMIAVHYAVSAVDFPQCLHCEPQQAAVKRFLAEGLLRESPPRMDLRYLMEGSLILREPDAIWQGTPKLKALVRLMQEVPIPREHTGFIDPRTDQPIGEW